MTDFVAIKPVAVTEARLFSSSIGELAVGADPDPPEWNGATTYNAPYRVTRLFSHKIYQRITAGATATPPESDPVNWVYVGFTNRWRMFDLANNTQSSAPEQIIVVLTPLAFADRLVVLNLDAQQASVTIENTDYNVVKGMDKRVVRNWFDYFFERIEDGRTEYVFEDMPLRLGNKITLKITRPGGIARVGTVIFGESKVLGTTKYGASAGILNYDKKNVDDFGNASIVPRAYSKRMNVSLTVLARDVDGVHRYLTLNRSIPLVFIGANNDYSALIIYGWARSFEIVIAYYTHSDCALTCEGLI